MHHPEIMLTERKRKFVLVQQSPSPDREPGA